MAKDESAAFESAAARSLGLVGFSPGSVAVDALLDPGGACGALDALAAGEATLMRVHPALGPAHAPFAPAPKTPLWLRLTRGSAAVRVAAVDAREGEAAREPTARRVRVLAEERPCCDAPSCTLTKWLASAWIDAGEGERWLVAEQLATDEAQARSIAASVGARVAEALGVPLEGGEAGVPACDEAPLPAVSAAVLARFSLRMEGDRLVLRDLASGGPRGSARTTAAIGIGLAVGAALAWVEVVRGFSGRGGAASLGATVVGVILAIGAVAFLGVARFAAQYSANSAPLLAIAQGRFIPRPWVGRSGAVELRPEGRFGAAISIQELHGVAARKRDGGAAVELDSAHGQLDALVSPDAALVDLWTEALRRALASAAHPAGRATAKQRAREKRRAGPQGAPVPSR